jgi:hypothetical protein
LYPVKLVPHPEETARAWSDEEEVAMSPQVLSSFRKLEPQSAFLLDLDGRQIVVDLFWTDVEGFNATYECLLDMDFHSIESCQFCLPPS